MFTFLCMLMLQSCVADTMTFIKTSTSYCPTGIHDISNPYLAYSQLFPQFVITQEEGLGNPHEHSSFELRFEGYDPSTRKQANSTAISPVVATGARGIPVRPTKSLSGFQFQGFCAVTPFGQQGNPYDCDVPSKWPGVACPTSSAWCECSALMPLNPPYTNGTITLICKVNGNTACAGTYDWECPTCL